ncbi:MULTISPECIES: right-handed parallel beta-helix repeat-containing protein [unclassified Haloarcula]|uniref:right-handed parallel beta-helix repeat-containing protein n=1 Tax=unclassified Haloarcula TaxID=2624677 RepID=UPI000EF23520|nr:MULTISPECIES: right-handed parallel beta-helix repeat-containing protein [unclassified Haloarcula]RLM34612.1 right-handed parallel beta-helix repeat-containing protein [Haloarcula sp. Atlit-120R]RLM44026.1 right-handed parallel beta-helix repeat-containing protein [Haloarcula sp. Atlit-47R]
MTDDSGLASQIGRRKLLALLGSAAVTGGVAHQVFGGRFTGPSEEPLASVKGTPEAKPDQEHKPETSGENIRAHGAKPNPGDPSIEAAERNLKALQTAAQAAGAHGSIYVPEGTYYIGRRAAQYEPFNRIGVDGDMPPGISIYGAGPQASELAITERLQADSHPVQTGFRYMDDVDHGTVVVRDVRLNGNYENLPNLRGAGGGSRCIKVGGDGDLHLSNAHIRGWYQEAILGRDVLRTVNRCTFEDNAIADHNYSDGGHVGHHITTHASKGNPLRVTNSRFIDCSGSAIDVRFNAGEISVRNCYVTGTGANFCKLSAASLLDVRRVFHRANTPSLEAKLDDIPGHEFDGRQFIQRIASRADTPPTVRLNDVVTTNMTDYALQCRIDEMTIEGDMIAIIKTNIREDDEVIRDRDSGWFSDIDIDRLSVHECNGMVFDLSSSNGTIQTLARNNNQGGLGNTADLTVETDAKGQAPFEPSVPSPSTVGINTASHSVVWR